MNSDLYPIFNTILFILTVIGLVIWLIMPPPPPTNEGWWLSLLRGLNLIWLTSVFFCYFSVWILSDVYHEEVVRLRDGSEWTFVNDPLLTQVSQFVYPIKVAVVLFYFVSLAVYLWTCTTVFTRYNQTNDLDQDVNPFPVLRVQVEEYE